LLATTLESSAAAATAPIHTTSAISRRMLRILRHASAAAARGARVCPASAG
jgi:hypothetical protein